MREVRIGLHSGGRTPLVVKGSLPRTFLGLGLFVEAALLFFGTYLLAETIQQPLEAGTATVVGAGLLLGLATVLLFYLVWPSKSNAISRREDWLRSQHEKVLTVYGKAIPAHEDAEWILQKDRELPRPMGAAPQADGTAGR